MILLGATFVGFLAARFLWLALRPTFVVPALVRPNYRGRTVINAAGVVLPLTAVMVEAGRAGAGVVGFGPTAAIGLARVLVILTVTGFGLLGLFDDLLGDSDRRGFRGHAGALGGGRLTTGGVKLVAGVGVALVVVSPVSRATGGGGGLRLVLDAALVALAANLANLLDRRPGRVIKAGAGAYVGLALATGAAEALLGVAVVIGAALALLLEDLHERVMLGDAGANVLGAALGLGVVLSCTSTTRTVVLVVVAVLNVASEFVSFSEVIHAVPPLRALDQAGRKR